MVNIVTAKELATLLRLTEATIYKLALNGRLPGFKIGDSWRFEMDEILKLFQGIGNREPNLGSRTKYSRADVKAKTGGGRYTNR